MLFIIQLLCFISYEVYKRCNLKKIQNYQINLIIICYAEELMKGFSDHFNRLLKDRLEGFGFQAVNLKSCISYDVLFRNERLWIGSSFDWRDQYLEIDLGHLYWFQDVMPRVIIIGNYSSYSNRFDPYAYAKKHGIEKALEILKDTIEDSIDVYEKHYSEILSARLDPSKMKYRKEFFSHLGKEVEDKELKKFLA